MSNDRKPTRAELELRLEELKAEYDLARTGLMKGFLGTIGAMISGLGTLVISVVAFMKTGKDFLTGNHIVIIFGILAVTILIYFSFVFGRAAKIKTEITKTKKLLEMSSGDKVR